VILAVVQNYVRLGKNRDLESSDSVFDDESFDLSFARAQAEATFSRVGRAKLLQNLSSGQNRSTKALTLRPSPRGRGNCKPAPALLPLPLGEGWGEGGNVTQ
jgi:hypothetical protein